MLQETTIIMAKTKKTKEPKIKIKKAKKADFDKILGLVKELATFGGDITKMVPCEIVETVLERIRRK